MAETLVPISAPNPQWGIDVLNPPGRRSRVLRFRRAPLSDLADALRGELHAGCDWIDLIREANDHFVAPTLYEAVCNDGGIAIPTDAREYLHLLHHLNRARNACLRDQALEAITSLNASGITPVLLKGAVLLLTTPEHRCGRRLLSDLDLMLGEADLAAGMQVLLRLGYQPVAGEAGRHAFAKLARPKDAATIDLHHRPPGPAQLYRQRPLAPETSLTINGARMRLPSATDQVMHLIAHDMFNDGGLRDATIQMRHLVDVAELSKTGAGVDWKRIRAGFSRAGMEVAFDVYALGLRRFLQVAADDEGTPSLLARVLFRRLMLKSRSSLLRRLDGGAVGLARNVRRAIRKQVGAREPHLQ